MLKKPLFKLLLLAIFNLSHFFSFAEIVRADVIAQKQADVSSQEIIDLINQLTINDEDTDADIRRKVGAALTLSEIGQPAIPYLLKNLNHSNKLLRINSIQILGMMREKASITTPDLMTLLRDPDSDIRAAVVESLGRIGSQSGDVLKPKLLSMLNDESPSVRIASVNSLHRLKHLEDLATPYLVPLLKNSDMETRTQAFSALDQVVDDNAALMPYLVPLIQDKEVDIRREAISILHSRIVYRRASIKIPDSQLLELLQDSDRTIRYHAASIISSTGKAGEPGIFEKLASLMDDPDVSIRGIASDALATLGERASFISPKIISLLKESDPGIRGHAVHALGSIKAKSAIPYLIPLLKDSNPEVRRLTVYALGSMKAKSAIPYLIPLLQDSESDVRGPTTVILNELGHKL